MFLGTNEDKTSFWTEASAVRILRDMAEDPTKKFWLIKVAGTGNVTLKPVIVQPSRSEARDVSAVTADGQTIGEI